MQTGGGVPDGPVEGVIEPPRNPVANDATAVRARRSNARFGAAAAGILAAAWEVWL
jgi:hypothetical protein